MTWSEVEASFRLEDVTHSPAFFDVKKLDAFNGEYIRRMTLDAFIERAAEELPAEWDRDRFAAIAPHIQERLVTFAEVPGKVDFLFWPTDGEIVYDESSWDKAFAPEWAAPLLDDVVAAFADVAWDADALKAAVEQAMAAVRAEARQGAGTGPRRGHRTFRRAAAVRIARGARTRRDVASVGARSSTRRIAGRRRGMSRVDDRRLRVRS